MTSPKKKLSKEEIDKVFDDAIVHYLDLLSKNPQESFTCPQDGVEITIIGHDVIPFTENLRDKAYKEHGYPTRVEEAFDRACIL